MFALALKKRRQYLSIAARRELIAVMHLTVLHVFYVLFSFFHGINTNHFRGGTISWKPIGNGTEVINYNFNNSITYANESLNQMTFFQNDFCRLNSHSNLDGHTTEVQDVLLTELASLSTRWFLIIGNVALDALRLEILPIQATYVQELVSLRIGSKEKTLLNILFQELVHTQLSR